MADFKKLEHDLNSDPKIREEFLKDPVEVMRRHGFTLTPQMEADLKNGVAKSTTALPNTAGSTTRSTSPLVDVSVNVSQHV